MLQQRFAHCISLRKALYDVKNEIASKTTWNWPPFHIKKATSGDIYNNSEYVERPLESMKQIKKDKAKEIDELDFINSLLI